MLCRFLKIIFRNYFLFFINVFGFRKIILLDGVNKFFLYFLLVCEIIGLRMEDEKMVIKMIGRKNECVKN